MPMLRFVASIVAFTFCAVSSVSAQDAKPAPSTSEQNPAPKATQEPHAWVYVKDDDALAGKVHDKFILDGKYLKPPRTVTSTPSLVIVCDDGKVKQNYFFTGTVITRKEGSSDLVMSLPARIDGKKTSILGNAVSTDGQSVFFTRVDLKTVLRAHLVIVGVDEYLGAEVVIQFDMPDPTEVLSKCANDRILKDK